MSEVQSITMVEALGRLLSSHALRTQFAESAESVAELLNVCATERPAFVLLDLEQVMAQARILIDKRWHEIRKLAPKTVSGLGPDGKEMFDFFADHYWPEGHLRHVQDAHQFFQFLIANKAGTCDALEFRRLVNRLAKSGKNA